MKICNEALKAGGFPDIFFLFNDAGTELAQQLRRRQAHPADQLHRLDQGRPHGRRARRAAHGPLAARARRQQRDHRRRDRRPEARDPGDRVRRRRHRRPALHHHAPPVRARVDLRRRAGQAGRRLQAGREEDRRPDRPGQPDGPAQQPRRGAALTSTRSRRPRPPAARSRPAAPRSTAPGQLRAADDRHRPDERRRSRADTKPSRRSCT